MSPHNNEENAFAHVLEIENTPDILAYTVPGYDFFLWPYIRFTFLAHCLEWYYPNLYEFPASDRGELTSYPLFCKTLGQALPPWPKRDIMIYSGVGSCFYKQKDGKLYNHYIEPLAEVFPQKSMILDASSGPEFISGSATYALRRTAPLTLLAGKATRFMPDKTFLSVVNAMVEFLVSRVKKILDRKLEAVFIAKIRKKLLYNCKLTIAEYHLYKFFLRGIAPKLCIIEGAYYGGCGHLIPLLKAQGAHVADMQHGAVYARHLAYHWARALVVSPPLQGQMPDTFLSYGTYWHQFMQIPGQCVPIGNPWFTEQIRNCNKSEGTAIIFTLAAYYNEFVPYVIAVRDAFPDREIIVRPHPSEKQIFAQSELMNITGVHFDNESNLYVSLSQCAVVIGEISTSLYEAAALGKRVFMKSSCMNKNFDARFFVFYHSPQELVSKMQETSWKLSAGIQAEIFADNWQEQYKRFVNSLG